MRSLCAVLCTISLLWLSPAWAASYFSEASGSDSSTTCSSGAPCRTARKIIERTTLQPGDFVNLKCNEIYREPGGSITPEVAGTNTNRITLQSYGPCYEQRGVHEGATSATRLVDVGVNFSTLGVTTQDRVHNLTKGAHCYVSSLDTTTTTNDTVVCSMGLGHTLQVNWEVGDRYLVENKPIMTHAILLNNTGDWSCSGGICSTTLLRNPGRHVWFNGRSTHEMMHDGTCSQAGMGAATDGQYCAQCIGPNVRNCCQDNDNTTNCSDATLYVKTATNPATRWTNPGVEVLDEFYGSRIYDQSTKQGWTLRNIAMEKVYGRPMTITASNITMDNVRLGWEQRKNCQAANTCWEGRLYPWQNGQDNRGGELMQLNGVDDPVTPAVEGISNILITRLHGHDCENNCISFSGFGSVTGTTISDCEIYNNDHSLLNSGLSGAAGGLRGFTLERCVLHGGATIWHSGGTGLLQTAIFRNTLVYDVPSQGDPRQIVEAGRPDPYGIYLQDPGDYTFIDNIIIDGGHGVRMDDGDQIFTRNVVYGNRQSGINANNGARARLNDNILADNGTGSVSSSAFQVGCAVSTCSVGSSGLYRNAASNDNKFWQPTGAGAFGFMSGGDTSITLADWQVITAGDSTSTNTADCFMNASIDTRVADFNLSPTCNDVAAGRGPFREVTFASVVRTGANFVVTFTNNGVAPLSACDVAKAAVTLNGVAQTVTGCTVSGNTATFTVPSLAGT